MVRFKKESPQRGKSFVAKDFDFKMKPCRGEILKPMPNTYTQILIQYVFAVKYRQPLIREDIRIPIEKYITGVIQNHNHKLLRIYCMPDHCHILVGLHPAQSISDLARVIKSHSSKWINEQKFVRGKFQWQGGYGAFSYCMKEMDVVVKYIMNQPIHHKKASFHKEYMQFLDEYEVEYDDRYVFE